MGEELGQARTNGFSTNLQNMNFSTKTNGVWERFQNANQS